MRGPALPIGQISRTGNGIEAIAETTRWYVYYEGPQRLFVDANGRAYRMPVGATLGERWCERHADWLVGTYSAQAGDRKHTTQVAPLHGLIVDDLLAHWAGLVGCAA